MKYVTIMEGVSGEFRTEYDTREQAEEKARSIRNLGWECRVEQVED